MSIINAMLEKKKLTLYIIKNNKRDHLLELKVNDK